MKLNLQHPAPVKVTEATFQQKKEFTYLESIVRHDGREGNDIKNHLSKARNAFRMMNNVWRSSQRSSDQIKTVPELCFPPDCTARKAGVWPEQVVHLPFKVVFWKYAIVWLNKIWAYNNRHCLRVASLSCVNLRDVHLNNCAVGVTLLHGVRSEIALPQLYNTHLRCRLTDNRQVQVVELTGLHSFNHLLS